MSHDEFMKELCKIVAQFSERVSGGDPGPCFCLQESVIAKLEVEQGSWRGSRALLHVLKQKLEVE